MNPLLILALLGGAAYFLFGREEKGSGNAPPGGHELSGGLDQVPEPLRSQMAMLLANPATTKAQLLAAAEFLDKQGYAAAASLFYQAAAKKA